MVPRRGVPSRKRPSVPTLSFPLFVFFVTFPSFLRLAVFWGVGDRDAPV